MVAENKVGCVLCISGWNMSASILYTEAQVSSFHREKKLKEMKLEFTLLMEGERKLCNVEKSSPLHLSLLQQGEIHPQVWTVHDFGKKSLAATATLQ